jgi:hypothetical protein
MNSRTLGLSLVLTLILLVPGAGLAAPVQRSYNGYLIDRQCADAVRHDSDPRSFIQHHTKNCMLMTTCQSKGFCIYSEGTWYDLDLKGNVLASKLIKASKRKSGFYVRVKGTATKTKVLNVSTIVETEQSTRRHAADKKDGTR